MENEEFWTTYISATSEEDEEFGSGCGKMILFIALALAALVALAWLVP